MLFTKKTVFLIFLFLISVQLTFAQTNKKGKAKSSIEAPELSPNAIPSQEKEADYPYTNLAMDTLNFEDSIPDRDVVLFAEKMAKRAVQLEDIIINNRLRVEYSKKHLEEEYAELKENEDADEDELNELKENIKALKKEKKRLTRSRLKAKKIAARAVHNADRDIEDIREALPRIKEEIVELALLAGRSRDWIEQDLSFVKSEEEAIAYMSLEQKEETETTAQEKKDFSKKRKKSKKKPEDTESEELVLYQEGFEPVSQPQNEAFLSSRPDDYVSYDSKNDVLRNPPSIPCNLPVNSIDQFSGKIHKQTEEAELFRYTNDFMKQYLNGKPHIQCFTSTSQLGEVVAVVLTVYVRDNNAENAFGGLKQNYNLTFKFIDGTTKSSPNLKEETPQTIENGAVTMYKGSFPLGKNTLKKIRTTELDKVRIQWATGYEDYEIYNIDLLSQQANCILGK